MVFGGHFLLDRDAKRMSRDRHSCLSPSRGQPFRFVFQVCY